VSSYFNLGGGLGAFVGGIGPQNSPVVTGLINRRQNRTNESEKRKKCHRIFKGEQLGIWKKCTVVVWGGNCSLDPPPHAFESFPFRFYA